MVDLLITHGADLEAKDNSGGTPLHIAARNGFKAIAEILLKNKSDVNARNDQANRRDTPLHLAVNAGHKAMVELLLANGTDNNAQNDSGWTPLISAAKDNNMEIAKLLIDKKANVNVVDKEGNSALHSTVRNGQSKFVKLLLQSGADMELKTSKSVGGDPSGFTSLHVAAAWKRRDLVEMLLAAKANPNPTNAYGETPLHSAAGRGSVEIAEVLIKNGAVVDAQRDNGWTPLIYSILNSDKAAAELLLVNKADPNIQTKSGDTPLGCAKQLKSPAREEFIDLLLKYGANENAERLTRISAGRDLRTSAPAFFKGNSASNHYSLFEILALRRVTFPDLAKARIHRLDAKTQQTNIIAVNLEEILKAGDCSKNIWLEWGDIVELPELDHPISQGWSGYPKEYAEAMQKCLERKVSITVKGETTNVTLLGAIGSNANDQFGKALPNSWGVNLPSFILNEVISRFLRASSDKARIKIRRVDPVTKEPVEIMHNLEKTDDSNNVRLLDGDAIEIPERDPNAPPPAPEIPPGSVRSAIPGSPARPLPPASIPPN